MNLATRPHPAGHAALRTGRASLAGHCYHVTASTLGRLPVFADFATGCIAARSFTDVRFRGDSTLLAWVLMPDHAHWLLQLGEGDSLAGVVRRLKSASARQVNLARGAHGPLWSPAYHDHAIRSQETLEHVARYIIENPVRAGLAASPGEYPFWDMYWLP